jgi:hypothetical protein
MMKQSVKLFNNRKLRAAWDANKNTWWVSVIDVIAAVRDVDYDTARNYWKQLKCRRVRAEKCKNHKNFISHQLKLTCKDGKERYTDVMLYKDIVQLILTLPACMVESLLNFKKMLGGLAANTKTAANLFNYACVKQHFRSPPLLQTTVMEHLF